MNDSDYNKTDNYLDILSVPSSVIALDNSRPESPLGGSPDAGELWHRGRATAARHLPVVERQDGYIFEKNFAWVGAGSGSKSPAR